MSDRDEMSGPHDTDPDLDRLLHGDEQGRWPEDSK